MARYQARSPSSAPPCRSACKIPDVQVRAEDRRRQLHAEEMARTRHRAVGAVHRRAVHPPGVPRPHRHAADADAGARRSSPTRTPTKRDKLVDTLAGVAGVQLLLRQQVGRHPPRQARAASRTGPHGTFAFHDWIREAIADDKPYDEFAREILAATGDETHEPADRLVQGTAEARTVRRRRRPGLPRPAHGLCPVPPSSLREVEPGRLLGHGRLLRPRRPQERASPGRRCSNQQNQRQVDLQQGRPATSPTSAPARPPIMKPLDGEPMTVGRRRRSAAEAGRLDGRREEPVLRPGRRQSLLGALLRPRHRRSAGRHARHQSADATPNCSTPWPRTWSTTSTA